MASAKRMNGASTLVSSSRWSAKPLAHNLWSGALRAHQLELERRGFALACWRDCKGTFSTVGEKIRPGIDPEHGADGSPFAVVWMHAATEGEVSAFLLGIGAGEILGGR